MLDSNVVRVNRLEAGVGARGPGRGPGQSELQANPPCQEIGVRYAASGFFKFAMKGRLR